MKKELLIIMISCACAVQIKAQNTFQNNGPNVGIGTDAPNAKLEVVGPVRFTLREQVTANGNVQINNSDGHFMLFSSSLGPSSYNSIVQPGDQAIIYSGNDKGTGSFVIAPWSWEAGGNGLRMDKIGNVSIGTPDSKGYKLAVNGNAIFARVRVKSPANWPDYVFDKQYSLLPLSALEKYITVHNHLPEIPSADEVHKEGIELFEMNQKLLQKVEELTLHMIELNKRLDSQEKLIAAQQQQILIQEKRMKEK
ncbi:MAG TPA: hypothetical protein VM802_05755 [Chitinophaga sp.]|uniref:hypothetical protein n=1 Tax=Chitinophaga sp. TaxID=1869181 RepID=UPI002CAD6017|nr:hypothetical protein [Chitinophaga sp.]HVI44350.1 hypothetical protein [Chitinophaga sp.]